MVTNPYNGKKTVSYRQLFIMHCYWEGLFCSSEEDEKKGGVGVTPAEPEAPVSS